MHTKCQNDDCKRPFAPGQIVYVTSIKETLDSGGVSRTMMHCCCPDCRATVEKKVAQADMFPLHQIAKFQVEQVQIPDAYLRAMPNTIKDGLVHSELRIAIPYGIVSTDEILGFRDRCNLTLSRSDIVDYETEPGQETPDEKEAIDTGLAAALALMEGATDRWAERSNAPMTDKELKAAIAEEFGLKGDAMLGPDTQIYFEGGAEPKFWYNVPPTEPPTLSGRDLVKRTRKIMSIIKPEKKS
jgi:hypothetical protein